MIERLDILVQNFGPDRFKFQESLIYQTYHKIEAKAEAFFIATTQRELTKILNLCLELKIPFMVYGSGTKIVFDSKRIQKLVIRNRSSQIKIIGIKGKVGKGSIGVEEAKIEIDSGVTIADLDNFLARQVLTQTAFNSPKVATIGGSLLIDNLIKEKCEKIKIWNQGEILEISTKELGHKDIIISAVMIFKAVS